MQNLMLVYVSSPFAGDIEANIERAKRYCRFVLEKKCVPIAPHLHYPQFLNDSVPEERAVGMDCAIYVLTKCNEMWVFGEAITSGMAQEIEEAKRLNITIKYFDTNCEEVWKDA